MEVLPTNPGPPQALLRYGEELSRFLHARVSPSAEADELWQELWYRWARTAQQQPLQDERAWLYRVARHLVIDHYRRRAPLWLEEWLLDDEEDTADLDRSPLQVTDASPEELFWQAQFWEALYEGLETLPGKQREVFVQHEFDGLTLREIAEARGDPLKTIISRKGYAMRRLRDHLQAFFDDLADGE
jgi:RNA polymerase sigma factor (sigma-70 family)